MKKAKAMVTGTLAVLCLLTSVVFLGSFSVREPDHEPDLPQADVEAWEVPEPSATPELTPELTAEEPADREQEETGQPVMATAHFAMEEYRCDCDGYCSGWPCPMNPALLDKIEALRGVFGQPVIITSGVRCEARNAEVGGVAWSFHMRGCAADLYCPGVAVGEMAGAAKDVGLNVLPYYAHGYIHVEI